MLAKTDSACYGPYVRLIEFASFQAECQMDRLPSDKSDEVFPLLFSHKHWFHTDSRKLQKKISKLSFSRILACLSHQKHITEVQRTIFT